MFDFTELTNWHEYTKTFIAIFILVSPPIIAPVFLGLVGGRSEADKKRIAFVGTIGFLVTMLVFTFFGGAILDVFGITLAAFRIAGGFFLLLIALDMIRSKIDDGVLEKKHDKCTAISIGMVPLAIPILAGPGTISTVLIFANIHKTFSHQILVAGVILVVAVYLFLMLRFTVASGRLFGKTATIICNRIIGLIISAIAFEFILDGIAGHFPAIETVH